ncbi:MAG: DUF1508 domain-containing protein [Bacteroidales bacterium]|nr:DUF1508 domain-containing protein [Bacteroidales bacterium]
MSRWIRRSGLLFTLATLSLALLSTAPAQVTKKKTGTDSPGVAEIYEGKDGFRFRIKGSDDKSLAISPKGYKTRADCEKALETIKDILTKTKVVDGKAK